MKQPLRRGDPWMRFAVVFSLLAVGSEAAYFGLVLESDGFRAYLEGLARLAGWFLRSVGHDVVVSGAELRGPTAIVAIADGCDAVQISALLTAAMLALPIAPWRRVRGWMGGLLCLQILNLVRIVTLYWIGASGSDRFALFHETIWPALLIVATIAILTLWALWETRDRHETA